MNISDEHKFFTWTPERTGSNHFTNIISKLGFKGVVLENDKITSYLEKPKHNHTCRFFENHLDYKFIISIRNPYSMVISRTGAATIGWDETSKDKVKDAIEGISQNPFEFQECCQCFHIRKPDYIIRQENLYEDWIKIPFVNSHELNLSGELERLTKIRVNNQKNTEDKNYWKKYYTQSSADLVYYSFSSYFEIGGYDKNSWK